MLAPSETMRLRLMGRGLAVVGLALLAVAALLSGTDRTSRNFPSSPSLVGWPYDTGASRAHAMLAFVQKGPDSALDYARRSILSDPISIQPVSILGRAQLYAGRQADAYRTFTVAGQLGWRDSMTQIYWLVQAMQSGDSKVAAQRLDALLRQSPHDDNRDKFLAMLSATPDGRSALAERLKLVPNWAVPYATDLNDVPQDQLIQRTDVMQRAGKGVWQCSDTAVVAQRLINFGLLEDAQSIWRLNCSSSGSLIYDGSFDVLDTTKPITAFDWQISTRGDAQIAVVKDKGGNRSLSMTVEATTSLPIIRQLVVLKPGTYRLTWRTPETLPNQAESLRVSLVCKLDLAAALQGKQDAAHPGTHVIDFTVDGQCPARPLIFWLAPNAQVQLDDIQLKQL